MSEQPGENIQETSEKSLGTICNELDDNARLETTFEECAVVTFGRRIEAWAEKATNAHSDTEAQLLSSNLDSEQCYGMIHDCEARLILNMPDFRARLVKMSSVDKWVSFQISFVSNTGLLALEDNTICGQLRDGLHDLMHQICNTPSVRLVAYASIEKCLRVIELAKRQHKTAIMVDVNVYGLSSDRAEVGRILSIDRLYLQHPRCGRTGFEYKNLHMLLYQTTDLSEMSVEREKSPVQTHGPEESL